ncbi:hypothetical protein [Siphonobacter curvatus]|nr:hypothetical protein [Siphonobacter curvatus]
MLDYAVDQSGERLIFEYPGIGVSFNIVRYAGLYLVRVDGQEIFNNPDPLEVVDFIMVT